MQQLNGYLHTSPLQLTKNGWVLKDASQEKKASNNPFAKHRLDHYHAFEIGENGIQAC